MQDFTDEKIQCGRCRSIDCICGIAGEPLFEQRAGRSLAEVTATFCQRGTEYGDTWRNNQWVITKQTLRDLRHNVPDEHLEAIAAAVLVDTKYQRHEGPYKRDSSIDLIAYAAYHADAMRELKEGK